MKQINIIGGSLYGVMLALNLKKKNPNIEVTIHEKNDTILTSWQNITINGIRTNRGLHGIEIPRAKEFIESFGPEFIYENFERIPNYKILWINGELVPFKYPAKSAPIKYRRELRDLPNDLQRIFKTIETETNTSSFLGLIKRCSIRYSDYPQESLHLFLPWFLPGEYFYESKYISNQSSEQTKSHYLIPKSGIFSDLVEKANNLLNAKGIIVNKNSSITPWDCRTNNEEYIWSSNSIGLLKLLKNTEIDKCFTNKRNLNVHLYSIYNQDLHTWNNKFQNIVSEILVLDERAISMGRVSFLKNQTKKENTLIVLETFHELKNTSEQIFDNSFTSVLLEIFNCKITYIGSTKAGSLYSPGTDIYKELDLILSNIEDTLPYKVLFKYWWPINTAHAADAAMKDAKLLLSD